MTRIDFYILKDVALPAMHRFACRLAARAIASGQPVHLHTTDEAAAQALDTLLWDYPDRRFLPHALGTAPTRAPVLIGWDEPTTFDGVLVNLTPEVPRFFNRFHRVMEVVVHETRDQGRERFRFYRHRGYPLYDHHMDEWETDPA